MTALWLNIETLLLTIVSSVSSEDSCSFGTGTISGTNSGTNSLFSSSFDSIGLSPIGKYNYKFTDLQ